MQGLTSLHLVTIPLTLTRLPIEVAFTSLMRWMCFLAFSPWTINTWYSLSSSGGSCILASLTCPYIVAELAYRAWLKLNFILFIKISKVESWSTLKFTVGVGMIESTVCENRLTYLIVFTLMRSTNEASFVPLIKLIAILNTRKSQKGHWVQCWPHSIPCWQLFAINVQWKNHLPTKSCTYAFHEWDPLEVCARHKLLWTQCTWL